MLVARAIAAGFRAVERAGLTVLPGNMAVLQRLPCPLVAALLYPAFRSEGARSALAGAHARDEALAMLRDLLELGGGDVDLEALVAALS